MKILEQKNNYISVSNTEKEFEEEIAIFYDNSTNPTDLINCLEENYSIDKTVKLDKFSEKEILNHKNLWKKIRSLNEWELNYLEINADSYTYTQYFVYNNENEKVRVFYNYYESKIYYYKKIISYYNEEIEKIEDNVSFLTNLQKESELNEQKR